MSIGAGFWKKIALAAFILGVVGVGIFLLSPLFFAKVSVDGAQDKANDLIIRTLASNVYSEAIVYSETEASLKGFQPNVQSVGAGMPCAVTPLVNTHGGYDIAVFVKYCDQDAYYCYDRDGGRDVSMNFAHNKHASCLEGGMMVLDQEILGNIIDPNNTGFTEEDEKSYGVLVTAATEMKAYRAKYGSFKDFNLEKWLQEKGTRYSWGQSPLPSSCGTKMMVDVAPNGSQATLHQSMCSAPGKSICKEISITDDNTWGQEYLVSTDMVRRTYHCL